MVCLLITLINVPILLVYSWFPVAPIHQMHVLMQHVSVAQVNTLRGQQTYSYSSTGFTLLAESHLYHAQYPVLDYNTSQSGTPQM